MSRTHSQDIFRAVGKPTITIVQMSNAYHQLLEATIQHLEDLKAHGVRFVSVSPETLAEFGRAVPTMSSASPVSRAPHPPPGSP